MLYLNPAFTVLKKKINKAYGAVAECDRPDFYSIFIISSTA